MHHTQTYAVILVLVCVLGVNYVTSTTNMPDPETTATDNKLDTETTTTNTKQDTETSTTDTKQDVEAISTEQSNMQGANMTTTPPDTLDVSKIKDMFPTIFAILEKYENDTNADYEKVLEEIKKDSKYADFKTEFKIDGDITTDRLKQLVESLNDDKDDDTENGSRNNRVAIGSVVMVTMISMFILN